MLKKISLLLCLLTGLCAFANENPKELVKFSAVRTVQGSDPYLAILFENKEHWHTYWKNPGDAGIPLSLEFTSGTKALDLTPMEWPAPEAFIQEGGLLGLGYNGRYALFIPLKNFAIKAPLPLKVVGKWLVCKDICIPGEAVLEGTLTKDDFKLTGNPEVSFSAAEIEKHFNELPVVSQIPNDLKLSINRSLDGENLEMQYSLSGVENAGAKKILIPFPQLPFNFKHEQLFHDPINKMVFAKTPIDWDGAYQEPAILLPPDGNFSKVFPLKFLYFPLKWEAGKPKAFVLEWPIQKFSLTPMYPEEHWKKLTPVKPITISHSHSVSPSSTAAVKEDTGFLSFLITLGLGLLGGFILNFMPCVLPMISLKLFGMIEYQAMSKRKIISHNLFYSLGILVTFWILASVIVLLKVSGEEVGWGFQLQSPTFVAVMAMVLFVFSLNLFGLFEFRTPGSRVLGGVNLKEGPIGDFLGGVLATILSTPCSAPFLGTALTFAFTSGISSIYLIFTMIGIGLALPFLLTSIFPGLLKFLPRPGAWMEELKKLLGVTLILTMIWLYDVFLSLIEGTYPAMILNGLIFFSFFAIYAYQKMKIAPLWKKLIFLVPLFFLGLLYSELRTGNAAPISPGSALLHEKQSQGLPWNQWSPAKMDELKAQKKLLFVDFTAKWCFTCKVNERLVLNTAAFKKLTEDYKVELLLADWTKRDALIGDWLKAHNRVGVPVYFVQKPDGTLIDLGETISLDEIEKSFRD